MREAIEKGVPNVNVQMEGENLKIVVPRPTTEAREGLIKLAKNHAEQVLSFFSSSDYLLCRMCHSIPFLYSAHR